MSSGHYTAYENKTSHLDGKGGRPSPDPTQDDWPSDSTSISLSPAWHSGVVRDSNQSPTIVSK